MLVIRSVCMIGDVVCAHYFSFKRRELEKVQKPLMLDDWEMTLMKMRMEEE